MSRPRLPDHEKRQKWAVLNVVPAERASIEAAAREAELTVNAFILSCTRTTRPVQMGHWQRLVEELVRFNVLLERIAVAVEDRGKPFDCLSILLSLRAIERQILGLTMPWLQAGEEEIGAEETGR